MRDIGKNIRLARTKQKKTQEELADALFVTRQTVSNYETGKSNPDVDTLLQIAQILDTDINTLIYGPPVPEHRRRAIRWIVISGALAVGLYLVYAIAFFVCKEFCNAYFVTPFWFLQLTLRPMALFAAGWCALHTLGTVCNWKMPTGKIIKIARILMLVFLATVAVTMIPFVVWMGIGIIQSLTRTSVTLVFPPIPVYYNVMEFYTYTTLDYPLVWALIGIVSCLLGIPIRQKTPADH